MLSALQLHRKTIKFQKPDTTQGGITYRARCCLLFSVLNKILRVGASGWFITNRDSVHMICRPSPWREGLLFTGYYLFEAPELPEQCPDCGKQATRPANKQERAEYLSRQTSSQEEAEEWD